MKKRNLFLFNFSKANQNTISTQFEIRLQIKQYKILCNNMNAHSLLLTLYLVLFLIKLLFPKFEFPQNAKLITFSYFKNRQNLGCYKNLDIAGLLFFLKDSVKPKLCWPTGYEHYQFEKYSTKHSCIFKVILMGQINHTLQSSSPARVNWDFFSGW